ncbi:MFS transporter [Saccharospirillum mangrovi]|uniref:MFS transporter n=1 Tax=Saccharospirillum mangrovi TaxID=2161747 RepID=UPI000D377F9E|nr:MFS transporter [Saccharospirillum mangrovi]
MQVNKYRFVILATFMLALLASQVQWLSHAAVATQANEFYAIQLAASSWLNIDLLAVVYMLVFLLLSFPASYVIDTFGLRTGLFIGGGLLALFSVIKAIGSGSLLMVLLAQTGLAVAQPFLLNAITAMTMHWFPEKERALAAGLAVFAQYFGMLAAMIISPLIVAAYGNAAGFSLSLWIYAVIGVVSGLGVILLYPNPKVHSPIAHPDSVRFSEGLKLLVHSRDMLFLLLLFAVGLGIVNAVTSLIDAIVHKMALGNVGGAIGGLVLIGGMVGSLVLSTLSDRLGKRKPVILLAMIGLIPAVFGFVYADVLLADPTARFSVLLVCGFLVGFFIMGIGPVGFQYAAERTVPAPESASQGMLLWIGQISGIVFVVAMSMADGRYLTPLLHAFFYLSIVLLAVASLLKDVSLHRAADQT